MRDSVSAVAEVLGATIPSRRSTRARAAVSTFERIDYTVELKRRGAGEYSVVLFSHHLRSCRVTGLPPTVLGFRHYLQLAGSRGRALIDRARSAQHRAS